MSRELTLSSTSQTGAISISGVDGRADIILNPPYGTKSVLLVYVQFDELWLETLATYIDGGLVSATLDGVNMTSTMVRDLKSTDVTEIISPAVTDLHIESVHAALNLKIAGSRVSAALSGSVTKQFIPNVILVVCTSVTGIPIGNSKIKIGTAAGLDDILSSYALTGLNASGKLFTILTEGSFPHINGNATLWVETDVGDTGVGATISATVRVDGRQV